MVAPAEDVRVHAKNIIEIISPLGLKDALGVGDGDRITVTIENLLLQKYRPRRIVYWLNG